MRELTLAIDGWIMLVGALAGVTCAIPGIWLHLRSRVMAGDAVTHAVLPGIAGAFLAFQTRDPFTMLAGAAISGVLCLLLAVLLERALRVDRGAALGVAFTGFFALGLIMIVRGADRVDLDPACVLYGALELTPIDTVPPLGLPGLGMIPRAVPTLVLALLVCVLASWLLFKELRLGAFDPGYASSLGARPLLMDLILAALVALVSVAAFEAVGSILVIALLAALPAAARMLCHRVGTMLILAPLLAIAAAVLGHISAVVLPPLLWAPLSDTSSAGMIAVWSGTIFLVAVVVGPERGLIIRTIRGRRLARRIAREEIVTLLWRAAESSGAVGGAAIHQHLQHLRLPQRIARPTLRDLVREGLIRCEAAPSQTSGATEPSPQVIQLTPEGHRVGESLIRSHRLWETYLTQRANLRPDHVHGTASRLEHVTGPALAKHLSLETTGQRDPHGRPIPNGNQG